jgi:hypothetical protein
MLKLKDRHITARPILFIRVGGGLHKKPALIESGKGKVDRLSVFRCFLSISFHCPHFFHPVRCLLPEALLWAGAHAVPSAGYARGAVRRVTPAAGAGRGTHAAARETFTGDFAMCRTQNKLRKF